MTFLKRNGYIVAFFILVAALSFISVWLLN